MVVWYPIATTYERKGTMPRVQSKMTRSEIIERLIARDGLVCQFPTNNHPLNLDDEGPKEVTLDHHFPQWWCKEQGWSIEEIWDLSNLKLMCKAHNAKKGDRIPNEDGSLPERPTKRFRYRRDKRAGRPELCEECNNGHDLAPDEICASCGCDAQRFPRWAKVSVPDCDHELLWCWACSIGVIERPSSIGTAMRQADSDELGEF